MARIFIVSRQYDSDQMVYQLDQHLRLVFGSSRVAALNRLAPGADVRLEIARYIQASNVVLVVIGRRWVGHPGLHHASDPVHLAVRTALEMPGKTVIPVLVDGAIPPDASELPSGRRLPTVPRSICATSRILVPTQPILSPPSSK